MMGGQWRHLVRHGAMGQIDCFAATTRFQRGARVLCRTARGVEVGRVLTFTDSTPLEPAGQLLRRLTPEDELLQARLEQHRDEAFEACCALLARRRLPATLLDLELLFDGRSLFFYFLGPITAEVEAVVAEMVETYEQTTGVRAFAELLSSGCGPDCGTAEAAGCESGGCATCAVSCAVRKT